MAFIAVAGPAFSIRFGEVNFGDFASVSDTSDSGFRLNFGDGSYWSIAGSNLVFGGPSDLPTAGDIVGFDVFEPGDVLALSVTGASIAAVVFADFVVVNDAPGFFDNALALADSLTGGDAGDDMRGGGAQDALLGGGGNDTLDGETGADLIVGDFLGNSITVAGGSDTIFGGAGTDFVASGLDSDTLYGDDDVDWLEGGGDSDSIFGGTQDDVAIGGSGNDLLDVGDGNDYAAGGDGSDTLDAGLGEDWLDGGTGNDLLDGNAGNDVLSGGDGDDAVDAGNGADDANGGAGIDVLSGGEGDDILEGDAAFLVIGAGNDTLYGGDGLDTGFGGAGNDRIYGGVGNDLLAGGAGNDWLLGGTADDLLLGDAGGDVLLGDAGIDLLAGGQGNDTLQGGSDHDSLAGEDGDDQLKGGTGNDVLDGGAGSDTVLYAGAVITLGSSGDTVTVDAGAQGIDTLISVEQIAAPDSTPPAAPIITGFSEDTGTPGDLLTSDATPSLSGTAEANALVTVFRDAVAVGITNADEAGNWSFTSSALTIGSYAFTATAGDIAGNTSAASADLILRISPMLDLTFLASAQGFVIQGDTAYDFAGGSVASAGDVNGDGFDDLIVGARGGDDGGNYAGEAYVVFGAAGGLGVAVTTDGVVRQVIDLTSLGSAQGFIIQGDTEGDLAGVSVASAGDVNGDGFDDLIVGALLTDNYDFAGEVYVVYGAAGGFGVAVTTDGVARQVIDLTSLAAAQGFIVQGDAPNDVAGSSVSSAGDVNGDGFDDLIIGAPNGDDGGGNNGETYVLFGAAGGFGVAVTTDGVVRQVIDLTSLGSVQGFIVQGDANSDFAGERVSSAGDVNGDGFDDLIVGASRGDDGGYSAGEAYVVFGAAGGFGVAVTTAGVVRQVIDLASLGSAQGFVVQGDTNYDFAGVGVSAAGDINGDGFDDLIVGAFLGDDGGSNAGEAYVVFGAAGGFGVAVTTDGVVRQVIDLASLGTAQGFVVQGDTDGDFAGYSVSIAGDFNGDGYDDLIVGAHRGDDGGNDAGETYVVFGAAGGFGVAVSTDGVVRQVIDLGSLDPAQGFIIQGDTDGDQAGTSVSSAGDVNGDGFEDLIVGAPRGADDGYGAGEAYVLFGAPFGAGTPIVLAGDGNANILIGDRAADTLGGNGGADILRGGAGNDLLGVADAGFADIDGGSGSDTLALTGSGLILDLRTATPAELQSIERIDLTGSGDNTLILDRLAAFDLTDERSGAGQAIVHVEGDAGDRVQFGDIGWALEGTTLEGGITFDRWVHGNAEMRIGQEVVVDARLDLTSLTGWQGFIVQGDTEFDFVSRGVSSAGDVNGDGFDDLIVGAPGGDDGGGNAGEAYVVFGAAGGFGVAVTTDGVVRRVIDLASLSSVQGFIVQGDTDSDEAGQGVSSAGDINGDGFDDLIVGAHSGDDGGGDAGEAYVVFGRAFGFGISVTTDGVVRQVIDLASLGSAQGFIIQGDTENDAAGYSVASAGDLNGDGFDDLIVGAQSGDDGGSDAGEAYVVFGAAGGFGTSVTTDGVVRQVIDLTSLGSAQGFIVQGDTDDDQAGQSVSSAGDINGDGFDDLIVGAWLNDDGGNYAGDAYVVFGVASGFGVAVTTGGVVRQVIDLTSLGPTQGFVIRGDADGDRAGVSVSSAGDVNGDGFDDLIMGAHNGDDGGSNAGEAYVVFGAASGFGVAVTTEGVVRQVIDLTSIGSVQGFVIQGDTDGDQAGVSVSSAGDVNGDGFGDLIVGALTGDDGGSNAGEAYVVFGAAGGFGVAMTTAGVVRQVIDLANLEATQGFVIQGDTSYDRSGRSVSSAGDVNGDGFDDLFVGGIGGDDGGNYAGEAYVLFGAPFGSGAPIVQTGDGSANILIGDHAADTLAGNGGADVMRGGAGNDLLIVAGTDFADIDGGTGIDTLVVTGVGQTLDLRQATPSELQSIERIDLTGTGNNTLILDELAFFDLTEDRGVALPALAILGNAGDAVQIDTEAPETWTLVGSSVLDGVTYDRYRWDADGGGAIVPMANAELWLDQDLGPPSFI